jgi:hypothetical protein
MNKYHLKTMQYSTSVDKFNEIEADFIKFGDNRVNFYTNKGKLICSFPSNTTVIYKIEYNGK